MCARPDKHGPKDGDAVAVYDRRHRFVGRGFYNGRSQIAVRILDEAGEGEDLDDAFLSGRIAAAAKLRRELLQLPKTTDAYRLVNAEGDGFSGLIVDVYGEIACVEVLSLGLWRRRAVLERALAEHAGVPRVVWRTDARIQDVEGFRVPPDPVPARTQITENGLRFHVDLTEGHKTGFFCDQRENRARIAQYTAGARVLDLCCYTGGFALYAAFLGNAKEVLGVDLDEWAVDQAQKNVELNADRPGADRVRFRHENAFRLLKRAAGKEFWDVVILDPPKLVRRRLDIQKGLRDYFDLNRLALRVVRPGGLLLTCSCSGMVSRTQHRDVVSQAAFEAGRRVRLLAELGPGPDHPTDPACPESLYLKAALLEVE